MMRPLVLVIAGLALATVACGGQNRQARQQAAPLPDGEGVYTLRYNPAPCLADRPELHVELRTTAGWERVALENGGDEDRVTALLERFGRSPAEAVPALGNLTNRVVTWSGQHGSRVFVVQVVDPPVEPTEAAPEG